ncbi:hypothetical protein BDR26DRAFT_860154 [Obelidium mucronatum]|nr:hypothetical protein BDR26DRAFT_860154 [Obelidium mucronatum]
MTSETASNQKLSSPKRSASSASSAAWQVTADVKSSIITVVYEAKSAGGGNNNNNNNHGKDNNHRDFNDSDSDEDDDMIGCVKDADVLLVLKNGDSLFAHSDRLKTNPYFKSHFNFLESTKAASRSITTVHVLPPFPDAFRTIIELIYDADQPDDYASAEAYNCISLRQFIPLFENAQFFQMQFLTDACVRFFSKNWRDIISMGYFAPKYLPEQSLCLLFDELVEDKAPADTLFEIMVYWCDKETLPSNFCEPARAIVEKYVKLEQVTKTMWDALVHCVPSGLDVCVTPASVAHHILNATEIEINCSRCGWVLVGDAMENTHSCPNQIHRAIRNKSFN